MATAGSIVVDLLMRTGSFETDTNRASKQMKKLGKDAGDTAADIGRAFGLIGGTIAGGLATAGTAVLGWTRQLVDASAELEKFSRLSGTNEQVFQRMAAGAATVGIQQDKLADIFKDTQDKLGDFLQTGGGAMKDFFDQIAPRIGLTAKELQHLSGPEVLQRYYSALEQAGASQAEMVFYMEAIASDSSMLAPLLARNGEGFRKWGDEAQRLGAVLDADTLEAMKEVKEQSNLIQLAFQGLKNEVAAELLPQFKELTAFLGSDQTKSAFVSITKWVGDLAAQMANGAVLIVNFIDKANQLRKLDAGGMVGDAGEDALNTQMARLTDQINYAKKNTSGLFGLPLTDGQEEARLKRINDLEAKRLEIQRELTKRYKSEAASENFKGVTGSVDSTARILGSGAASGGGATGASDRRAGALTKEKSLLEQIQEDYEALYGAGSSRADEQIAKLEREIALHGDLSESAKLNYDIQTNAFGALSEAQAEMLRNLAAVKDAQDDYAALYGDGLQKMADATMDKTSTMKTVADQAARNMQTAFADFLFDPFEDGLGGMVKGFAKAMQRIAAELAASEALKAIGKWASGYSGAGSSWINELGSAIGSMAGGRAGGGPVAAGSMYRVGEGGRPELFDQGGKTYLIPGDAGSVRPITAGMPASAIGGGGGITNNFNTTMNISSDGTSTTQQGDGSEDARRLNQFFTSKMNEWATQQSRPGGLFHQMRVSNG
ncbi:hypothetical protein [Stenotrophomonas maltophilia]|uniref:hypothetical protein n=1 Tax=Stenotrophomonas maltophilia TaxID=40324 RepID=UPI0020975591|nr:hypothetical protein [Stenotrophomonas maltophilia]MCO7458401.1 hypothetical protein [Stenotrophomonas maltophilia]MCO7466409.1 hypothetical protein [Stenotrophomonas maltophilia]MCO7482557.1 hypothetical protein [Stenotrophomonas maltophilia]MCO7491682.1 hypothetical protein [Stenotrophomonas maltophilia]